MRLLLFSDLHCDGAATMKIVERSKHFDVLVGAGDFATARRGLAPVIGMLRQARHEMNALAAKHVVLVPGNSESVEELRDACRDWPAAHVLHGSGLKIDDVEFFGVGGGIPPTPFGSWSYDFTEAQASELFAPCPPHCVLVTHSPPAGCLDVDSSGRSLGSTTVRDAIEAKKPQLVVCGHIHASSGKQSAIGDIPVVNAGPAGVEWTLLTIDTIWQKLLGDVLGKAGLTEDDAMNIMTLVHTHRLQLEHDVLNDRPGVTRIAPFTQRGSAAVVAALWRKRDDPKRTSYLYWYNAFNRTTPYEDVEDVPPARRERVEQFRALLLGHPWVRDVVPED
jgi:Icc-related predicted phosphoesterase